MLNLQFIGLNLHFAVSLLAALVAFAVFWLIFDAWTVRRELKELLKWAGFLSLSVGFLLDAANVRYLADILRLLGYLGVVWGQLIDPLQARPVYDTAPEPAPPSPSPPAPAQPKRATKVRVSKTSKRHEGLAIFGGLSGLLLPVAAGAVSWLYLRRTTVGLERHLRPVAIGFAGLSLFEVVN